MFSERENDVMRAATWGVWDAVKTDLHLGDAARKRGLQSRTVKGDAFETAFEWARQELKDMGDITDMRSYACSDQAVAYERLLAAEAEYLRAYGWELNDDGWWVAPESLKKRLVQQEARQIAETAHSQRTAANIQRDYEAS